MSDSDPRSPRKPRRPEPYTSDWSPRPIPQPAPERRTADPRTPTLRELAERERQRASLAAQSPQVADPSTAGFTELEAPVPVPSAKSCAARGRLADPNAAATFARVMRDLQGQWPSLNEAQRGARIENLINAPLRAYSMPKVGVVGTVFDDNKRFGLFDSQGWTLQIRQGLLDTKALSEKDGSDLAKTVWHEARHAEQYYLAARREAAFERDAGRLFYRTNVRDDVMRAALTDPMLGAGPDVPALEPMRYPDDHPAALGACADAMRTALITNFDVRKATINRLDAADAARSAAPVGRAREWADKAYDAAVKAYTALPEERDAFDIEPLVEQGWRLSHVQAPKPPGMFGP